MECGSRGPPSPGACSSRVASFFHLLVLLSETWGEGGCWTGLQGCGCSLFLGPWGFSAFCLRIETQLSCPDVMFLALLSW